MTARPIRRRTDLARLAGTVMSERGLEPEFPWAVRAQLAAITGPGRDDDPAIRDLTALAWCSIDNDDSRDLDQLTVCEALPHGSVRVRVAEADVDAVVSKGCPIDEHARINTTSVYTSARVFPMLPERLCTDLTSLNPGQERLAVVTEMEIAADASIAKASGDGPLPEATQSAPGMEQQLRMQDEVAQRLRSRRHAEGSLELQTFQPRAVFDGERVVDIQQQVQNRARQLIEELMIATNGCTARHLASRGGPSIRRVVRSPERWQRIVEIARGYGEALPRDPDSRALEVFLARRHRADPLRFPDLSLVIVKLMGSGEYVVEDPGAAPVGHFGLALRDYTHSTAPNRRYPDLITLRLIKATLDGRPLPYTLRELESLAQHCTQQEDAAQKVERQMRKSEAALLLESHVGQRYDALVTGRSASDTWVRTLAPPVEGKLVGQLAELDVGQQVRVQLVSTNVERGFIDFVLAD